MYVLITYVNNNKTKKTERLINEGTDEKKVTLMTQWNKEDVKLTQGKAKSVSDLKAAKNNWQTIHTKKYI